MTAMRWSGALRCPARTPRSMALRAVVLTSLLLVAGDQPAVLPPSTAMISPVTKSEAAEAR